MFRKSEGGHRLRMYVAGLLIRAAAAVVLMTCPAAADVFQYTDHDGTLVFVDDEGSIPREYRRQANVIERRPETPRTTPLKIDDNSILVPVRVTCRGKAMETWFLLDTGATHTGITLELARKLGITPPPGENVLTRLADGRYVSSPLVVLSELTVAPKTRYNMSVNILETQGPPLQFDGWLGMDFLGAFRHSLELGTKTINWFE